MGRTRAIATLLALSIAGEARAWTVEQATTLLDEEVTAVTLYGDRVGVIGPGGTWLLDRDGEVIARSNAGGRDLVLRDLDGDRRVEAFICGDEGVRVLAGMITGFAPPRTVGDERCAAIAFVDALGERSLVMAGEKVLSWPVVGDRLGPVRVVDDTPLWQPVLVGAGDRFAVVDVGASKVIEHSGWGRSTLATGGPVGGLAWTDRWVWSLPGEATVGDARHGQVPVGPDPGALAVGDLDEDGGADLIVLHGRDRLGILLHGEDFERVLPAPAGARDVAVLDGDGCADLMIATAKGLVRVRGRCDARAPRAEVVEARSEPEPLTGAPPPLDPDRPPLREITIEDGARLEVRIGETLDVRLVAPDRGRAEFAGRGGPPGLVVLSDGRVRYTALSHHAGTWPISVRIWGGGRVLQVETLELVVIDPDAQTQQEWRAPRSTTIRPPSHLDIAACVAGVGVAAGGSYAGNSWDRVGQIAFVPSISPAAAMSCEVRIDGPTRLVIGGDTAPTFVYLADEDVEFVHMAAGTLGVAWGGEQLRFGPYGTMGLLLLGGGMRFVWMPFEGIDASRYGVELRATAFFPSTPAGEVMLMFGRQVGGVR